VHRFSDSFFFLYILLVPFDFCLHIIMFKYLWNIDPCFIVLGNTAALHSFIAQVECSSNWCWQGKDYSDSIDLLEVSERMVYWLTTKEACDVAAFRLCWFLSLCPWKFNCWKLAFWFLCVNFDGLPANAITQQFAFFFGVFHPLLLVSVILFWFMQVRCIIRNIVRDWGEEVIFCSLLWMGLNQSSC
jgi:hypothetical protein